MLREIQVTFDAADPGALARFWAEAVGYQLEDPPRAFGSWEEALEAWGVPEDHRNDASAVVDPTGRGPRFFFQKVPEGKTAKNRVHLDLRAAPGIEDLEQRMAVLEAECQRLTALGATRLRREDPAPPLSSGFIVLQDPEGNEFCLD